MASLNYNTRLTNLQARKFDKELQESVISKSQSASQVPVDVKYLLESMRPIDKAYNDKTLLAADRVKGHLERGFNLHFERDYRTQGSVTTSTNIRVHSDFDLLTVIDKYHYPETHNGNNYTYSNPSEDIVELRRQSKQILKDIYDEVDDSHEKCITIFNKALGRHVDIVFSYWYNTDQYNATRDEFYRGLYFYKFPKGPKYSKADFPFAHIHKVNIKGDETNDGLRRGIRLLKNLRADSEVELKKLKSFQITSLVYSMDSYRLGYQPGQEIQLAKNISEHMSLIISNPSYRNSIISPNGQESPLQGDDIVSDILNLKNDLDTLIEDTSRDLASSAAIRKAIITY